MVILGTLKITAMSGAQLEGLLSGRRASFSRIEAAPRSVKAECRVQYYF